MFKECAEQDEQKNVGGRNQGRRAENAVAAEIELADDLVEAITAVGDRDRQILPEKPVGEKGPANQRQGPAHDAPRRLEDQYRSQRGDHEIGRGRVAGAGNQVGFENQVVEAERERDQRNDEIRPRQLVVVLALARRVEQENQHHQEADVQCPDHQAGKGMEGRDRDLVGRKRQCRGHRQVSGPATELALMPMFLEIGMFRMNLDFALAHTPCPC